MNKPQSMSLKEWFIKKLSIQMVISEKIIDQVITYQFDSANDATNTHKSIEISGFGKFYFNQKKADKQYQKLLAIEKNYQNMLLTDITDVKRNAVELKLKIIATSIKTLKPKVNVPDTTDDRGVDQQSNS